MVTRVGAGLSREPEAIAAGREAGRAAAAAVGGAAVDLAFLFLSAHHLDDAEAAVACAPRRAAAAHLVGCVADGVVAGERELEGGPGAAVWAAALPAGADISVFHALAIPDGAGTAVTGVPPLEEPDIVVPAGRAVLVPGRRRSSRS